MDVFCHRCEPAIAQCLAVADAASFKKVLLEELLPTSQMDVKTLAPNLNQFIELGNKVSLTFISILHLLPCIPNRIFLS
jgi:ABC-type dipeptide/oligopeptide/nickel transport system ATPase subunit